MIKKDIPFTKLPTSSMNILIQFIELGYSFIHLKSSFTVYNMSVHFQQLNSSAYSHNGPKAICMFKVH